ncbi:MAG: glycoside hydrolase domain-containing protein [Brevundimonas sp.]
MTTLSRRSAGPRNPDLTGRVPRARRVALPTAIALVASALVVPLAAPAQAASGAEATDYTQYVNPFIATESDFGQDGPGAFTPHGLAKITPLTNPRSHVGYDYAATKLKGFTSITLDGVGASGAGGDFLVSPTYQTYTARPSTSSYDKTFSHANESAAPGYYQAGLTEAGKGIDARVTADTRTGVEDYTFDTAGKASLVVDLANQFEARQGATLKVGSTDDGRATLSGALKGHFYNSSYTLYYYAETTVPVASVSTWGAAGLTSSTAQDGVDIGAILTFDVAAGDHVGLNVTLSPISAEQAARDQRVEIGGKNFNQVRAAAKAEWNAALGAVEVEADADDDPTGDLRTQLYTHLFRMNGSPLNATSTDGTYRGIDGRIYQTDSVHYDSWSLWDDFHKYSSIAAIYPDAYRDMAQSLVDLFAEMTNSGAGSVGSLMQSVPTVRWERAAVVVADALNKGADLEGLDLAYPSLVKHSLGNYSNATNESLGFISGSVGDTVGTSYDDWAMSVIATKLGKSADAAKYLKRSANYVNLFNKNALVANPQALASGTGVENVGLIMPRTASGFTANVDPEVFEASGAGLYQGTLWQYNWYDAQDMGGLIELMGGKADTKKALSYLYGEQDPDNCSRMLHLNANEIDLQSPYLFNYVGRPDRTQYWARSILTTPTCNRYVGAKDSGGELNGKGEYTNPIKRLTYQNATKGFLQTMDNDAATMSSVFVSGVLGLFPVTSGSAEFQIGSPVFEKTTIHYPGGKDFVIEANGTNANNLYIQDATLNGAPLQRTWLTYDELTAGGTVRFDMGSTPSTWGADSPMAYSMSDELPSSVYDKTSTVVTTTQSFNESAANDGSIGNAVKVSVTGATFAGEVGDDLSAQVTATGLPAGLTVKAVKTGDSTLDLTLTGTAAHHLLDDSTDALVVTLQEGAFAGTAPSEADRTLALKVRFEGFGIAPSTTRVTAKADGTLDAKVDLTLAGGATFAGATGATLPASFPGLDDGVSAVVTKTGATTARIAFTGTLSGASATTFVLKLSDAALVGATAVQVTGAGTTAMNPFTLEPMSATRAQLQALYDDARLITLGGYSSASFAKLKTAVAGAKTVLGNPDASEYVLGQALANLRFALDGLEIGEGGYRVLQGEAYDEWSGGSLKTEAGGSGTVLAGVAPDTWIAYRGLDFSESPLASFVVNYSHNPGTASASSKVELRTDSPTGPLVTTIALPTTNAWTTFAQATATFTSDQVAQLSGGKDVYLVFRGSADKSWVANIDFVQFKPVAGPSSGFTYTKLTPNNPSSFHSGLGRDGAAGAYTNWGATHNEKWIAYNGVAFGPHGADTFSFSYDKPTDKSTANTWIDLRLGSATGTTVASTPMLAFTGTGWNHYATQSISVNPAVFTGTQNVYVVFRMDKTNTSGAPYVGNFAWFQFGDSTAGATSKTVQAESVRSGYGDLAAATPALVDGVDYAGATLRTEAGSVSGQLAGATDGSWVRYTGVDVAENFVTSLNVRYDAPAGLVKDGKLAVYVDSMTGSPFVTVDLPSTSTGSTWGTFKTATVTVPSELTGSHALYLKLLSTPSTDQPSAANLDSFTLGYGADKAALRTAVTDLSSYEGQGERYIAADFAVYTRALATARTVLVTADATADTVKSARRALTAAAGQLQWKVVKQLADRVATAESLEASDWTAATWASLQTVVSSAKALGTTGTFDEYGPAIEAMDAALAALHPAYRTALSVPESVDPGTEWTVSGTGFEPGEDVTFSWTEDPAPTESWTKKADDAGHVTATVTLPRATPDGTHELRAEGQTSVTPATVDVTVSRVLRASSPSLTGAPATVTVGDDVELTVKVADGATGEVTLFDGKEAVGTERLDDSSSAVFTVSELTAGEHTFTAEYAGDAWYAAEKSEAVTVRALYTTALSAPSSVDPGTPARFTGSGFEPGEVVTFSWTTDPALTESWEATADANGAVSTTVTIPRATADGSYELVAEGETSATPATADAKVVAVWRESTTEIVGAPATVAAGGDLEVTVTVTEGATGEVTLHDGDTVIGTSAIVGSTATFTVPSVSVGKHVLKASYAGDAWYAGGESATVDVTAYATSLEVPESVDPGTAWEVKGAGFEPGETVTFAWAQHPALTESWTATADEDGVVTSTVTLPRATKNATYGLVAQGATSAVEATADVVVVTVMRTSTTSVLGVAATVTEGASFPVTVGVTAGATGQVTLYDGTKSLGAASLDASSRVVFTVSPLAVGSHSLTARYAGDAWYAGGTSVAVKIVVKPRTVPPVPVKVKVSVPVLSKTSQAYNSVSAKRATITADVSGATSGKVTFKAGTKVLGTASVSKVGKAYRATLRLSPTLKVGKYKGLTATAVTPGSKVTSVASAVTFTVVKAKTSAVTVKASKFTKGTRPTVTVRVAVLSNGRYPTGKVRVYVGSKVVRTVSLTSGQHGKVTVKLPSKYSKSIKVKAAFVPSSSSTVSGKTSRTITVSPKR